MNQHDEEEIKKEFQLERIIFFSDAVFAIIITIMILDVKLPEDLVHPTEAESKNALLHILPKLIAYFVSFWMIGNFWMRHLKLFSFLKDYTFQLIVLNLLFLFSISLFPFALSFAFSSSYVMQYTWGVYTYLGILYFTFMTQNLLIGYLIRNREELCDRPDQIKDTMKWRIRRLSFFTLPVFFVLMILGTFFNLHQAYVLGAMMLYAVVVGRLKRRWYPGHTKDDLTLPSFFRKPSAKSRSVKTVHK